MEWGVFLFSPCSRGSQTRRIIFLMRRDPKPGIIHPKGLADESMQLLLAVHLPDFRPIQLNLLSTPLTIPLISCHINSFR